MVCQRQTEYTEQKFNSKQLAAIGHLPVLVELVEPLEEGMKLFQIASQERYLLVYLLVMPQ